ncbi:uncharacterized protein LOC119601638 [Lucilia sericata]|uniref:uncharacterized protein LOC119601638 n=1 Tax=Lucilia sericata TaxID=13632 RepID=UPI0018A7EAE5|nr:uncharacterized protein LOC119601638 [Lucilia sericata]
MKWFAKTTRSFKLSFKMFLTNQQILTLLMVIALCATFTSSSPTQQQQQQLQQQQQHQQQKQQATTIRVQQCREGCLEKFTTKDALCQQNSECLTCWEECSKAPPGKISKTIRETWSLHTVSMVQQDSLVLVDVAWEQLSVPYQCLVTWEVSGGGLMGNLLTESFNVQLSLWPDTKYRVQVTCKNKLTGFMSRSLPLTIDTSEAVKAIDTTIPQLRPTIRKQAIASYITNIPLSTTTTAITRPTLPTITYSAAKQAPVQQFPVDNRAAAVAADDDDIDTNVVPYDDQQSAETINQHTNFIFNWHMKKNSDISAIEPLHKTEHDILAVLANIHKPLLFGMTAGITLLMLLLMFFACPLRKPRLSSDKAMLMAEDLNAHGLTLPPALTASRSIGVTTRNERIEHECKSPAMCSRDTLRV